MKLLQRGLPLRASSVLYGPRTGRRFGRRSLVVRAETRIKGKRLDPLAFTVGSQLGSGSFGEAYRGTLSTPNGDQQVVLKRVKARVAGAQEMQEAEQLINVLANKAAADAVAQYLGYALVDDAVGRLTKGLWLVWAYEGDKTLAYYLKRRDLEAALAADLGVDVEAAIPTAMKQIFECLLALHNVGIVHRDIKPANIVFDEQQRRFRLIDLGAAACLRTGTNYKPAETILDPCYCPPEEYVLPTDAPHLAEKGAMKSAMSMLLWSQHRPDCFDTYSAGIVLMQLCLPFLRQTSSLRTFNGALARCKHDLEEWRAKSGLPARQTAILDANDGAGWDLAASLLRPREVVTDEYGGVKFVNTGRAPRLTASAALKHHFFDQAQETAEDAAAVQPTAVVPTSGSGSRGRGNGSGSRSGSRSGSGSRGGSRSGSRSGSGSRGSKSGAGSSDERNSAVASVWGRLRGKLFDLEARVMQEATATEVQSTVVQQLRDDVKAGKASPEELKQEEKLLAGMQQSLQGSVKEMNSVFGVAKGFLSAVLGSSGSGSRGVRDRQAAAAAKAIPAPAVQPDKRMPKWAAKEVPMNQVQGAVYGAQQQQQQQEAAAAARRQAEEEAAAAGAAAAAAVGDAAVAATSFLAQGLKFTASAVNSLSTAADKMREQRQAAAAYVKALQAVQPPLTSQSRWADVYYMVPDLPEFGVLSSRRKEEVFEAYIGALLKKEQAALTKSLASFQELMVAAGVTADTSFASFEADYGSDPRFRALPTETDRLTQFDLFTNRLKEAREAARRREAAAAEAAARAAARAAADAAAKAAARAAQKEAAAAEAAARAARKAAEAEAAEAAYRQLMQEYEVLVASGSGYPQLKLKMWTDPRFDAVPEARRRQLYEDYVTMLQEAGLMSSQAAAAAAAATAAAAPVAPPAPPAAGGAAAAGEAGAQKSASKEQLDWLRAEQARLKEEYSRMEAKLREMEQRLQLGGGGGAGSPSASSPSTPSSANPQQPSVVVSQESDGGVSFRFGGSLPSAADFKSSIGGGPAGMDEVVALNGNGINGDHAKM